MNIHDKPFTYYRELLPLAEQLEKVTQVKSAGLFDVQAFKELSLSGGGYPSPGLRRKGPPLVGEIPQCPRHLPSCGKQGAGQGATRDTGQRERPVPAGE